MATTTTKNCTGENCGLNVNIDNAYESACFVRDTHFEMWDEEIEIDLDELEEQFIIYSF